MKQTWIALACASLLCPGCFVATDSTGFVGKRTTHPSSAGGALAEYRCYRATGAIKLDGKLDEPSWRKADDTGVFVVYSGEADPQNSTTARLVWDDRFLYAAFQCKDSDIYATHTERNAPLYEQDVVELFVENKASTEGHYLEYEVSPKAVLFDLYLTAPFKGKALASKGFAAGAKVTGSLNDPTDDDSGYTVEIAIPFEDIYQEAGARPGNGERVRLNLYRIDYQTPQKLGETGKAPRFLTWSPTTKVNFHMPERFGTVTFIQKPLGASEEPAE